MKSELANERTSVQSHKVDNDTEEQVASALLPQLKKLDFFFFFSDVRGPPMTFNLVFISSSSPPFFFWKKKEKPRNK